MPGPHSEAETIEVAARLLAPAQKAVALTGAGLSAESGIPTYRGADGVWTRFGEPTIDGWELFQRDPAEWWREARAAAVEPSPFLDALVGAEPNAGHLGLVELEQRGILAHVITQNIDNLHHRAGARNLTEIHGNRWKVRCMTCGQRYPIAQAHPDEEVPRCDACGGILKNDVVMFGEPIPHDALRTSDMVTRRADVFLAIGTSAVVYPAASFPILARQRGIPLIEINPAPTELSPWASLEIRMPAGEAIPAILRAIDAQQGTPEPLGEAARE